MTRHAWRYADELLEGDRFAQPGEVPGDVKRALPADAFGYVGIVLTDGRSMRIYGESGVRIELTS